MTPYVSFVTYSRNDGYGHAGLERLQHSLDVLRHQINTHGLAAEIIVVDWNPPPGVPTLAQALRFPPDESLVSTHVIEVPPRFHARYRGHAERGAHGAVAFNVGLRRARGRFALLRSSDVYYSDAVLERMARSDLDERAVYRVDRYDVQADALAGVVEASEFLAACARHVMQRHGAIDAPSEFGIRNLHTNACGDFLLMALSAWRELRGYPEGDSVACLDADSLVLHAAAGSGMRQEIWPDPCRLYKLAHGQMTVRRIEQFFRPHELKLDDLLARAGLPRLQRTMRTLLDYPRRRVKGLSGDFVSFERNFLPLARRWARGVGPYQLNATDDWGLAGEALREHAIGVAHREIAGEDAR